MRLLRNLNFSAEMAKIMKNALQDSNIWKMKEDKKWKKTKKWREIQMIFFGFLNFRAKNMKSSISATWQFNYLFSETILGVKK